MCARKVHTMVGHVHLHFNPVYYYCVLFIILWISLSHCIQNIRQLAYKISGKAAFLRGARAPQPQRIKSAIYLCVYAGTTTTTGALHWTCYFIELSSYFRGFMSCCVSVNDTVVVRVKRVYFFVRCMQTSKAFFTLFQFDVACYLPPRPIQIHLYIEKKPQSSNFPASFNKTGKPEKKEQGNERVNHFKHFVAFYCYSVRWNR